MPAGIQKTNVGPCGTNEDFVFQDRTEQVFFGGFGNYFKHADSICFPELDFNLIDLRNKCLNLLHVRPVVAI